MTWPRHLGLDPVLAYGYVGKLLRNGHVASYLAYNHRELLFEFQKLTESELSAGNGAGSERYAAQG
jgi:hypothetical protein